MLEQNTDLIEVEGYIIERFPNSEFLVELDNKCQLQAHLAGKIRRNRVNICPGDRVLLEMSPYDLTRGRIIYRLKIKRRSKPTNLH